jgi:hypothetical protein
MSTQGVQSLFHSIPEKDHCNLFSGTQPNAKKVMNMLHFSKDDLAVATGFSARKIRLDERMQAEIENRIREWALAINLVAGFFKDINKTILWFQTPNPLLGNVSPANMIKMGRFGKLLRFIQTAREESRKSA